MIIPCICTVACCMRACSAIVANATRNRAVAIPTQLHARAVCTVRQTDTETTFTFIHYALLHVDKRNPGTMQITNAIKLLTKSN